MSRGRYIIRRGLSWASFVIVLGLLFLSGPASAHLTEGGLRHEIIVEERLAGTTIWVRAPLPVMFGDEIAEAAQTGTPLTSDLLRLEQTGTGVRYRVDKSGFAVNDPDMTARLGRALQVTRDAQTLQPAVIRWRLLARPPVGAFDHPDHARAALHSPPSRLDPVFGQATLVYEMQIPSGAGPLSLTLGVMPLDLPASVDFDTRISRYTIGEPPWSFTQVGQLDRAVSLPPPIWRSAVRDLSSAAGALFVLISGLVYVLAARVRRYRLEWG